MENTDILIDNNNKIGLEINVEKAKYVLQPRVQNAGQNRDIKIAKRSLENM
jgi:uncharacterized protein YabE (DUF348 family)